MEAVDNIIEAWVEPLKNENKKLKDGLKFAIYNQRRKIIK